MPARFQPVVVAPSYNNAATLGDLISRIRACDLPLIVVNDGSTDATARVLQDAAADDDASQPAINVVAHPANRGKAAAIRTGAEAAAKLGYTHIVTIDTDGQHDPEDIPQLLAAAAKSPCALVLGTRSAAIPGYPARSMLGRRLSNLGIRLECGATLHDSQCGLRVYPLLLLEGVRCRAGRFAFETEVLTRAAWAGFPIVQVQVSSRYLPADVRVSHFKPVWDSLRCARLHAGLIARAILPLPHRRTCPLPAPQRESIRDMVRSLSPREMWRQLRADDLGRMSLAAGVAIGTYIANLPLYPVQTLVSLYVARRLHLHPLAVVLGSLLSTPPIGPVLILLAIVVGHFVLHGNLVAFPIDQWSSADAATIVQGVLLEWVVGSVLVGAACMMLTFAAIWLLTSRLATAAAAPPIEPDAVEPVHAVDGPGT